MLPWEDIAIYLFLSQFAHKNRDVPPLVYLIIGIPNYRYTLRKSTSLLSAGKPQDDATSVCTTDERGFSK